MTCAKCIHFADCLKDGETGYYGKDTACNNVEKLCKFFKDRSRFVELPCEVGDSAWFVGHNGVEEKTVRGFYINGYSVHRIFSDNYIEHFYSKIFSTRAEAEIELKRGEEKGRQNNEPRVK